MRQTYLYAPKYTVPLTPLHTCPQSGCYSVLLSQHIYQTACSRVSCSPKGFFVWWTKVKP